MDEGLCPAGATPIRVPPPIALDRVMHRRPARTGETRGFGDEGVVELAHLNEVMR